MTSGPYTAREIIIIRPISGSGSSGCGAHGGGKPPTLFQWVPYVYILCLIYMISYLALLAIYISVRVVRFKLCGRFDTVPFSF